MRRAPVITGSAVAGVLAVAMFTTQLVAAEATTVVTGRSPAAAAVAAVDTSGPYGSMRRTGSAAVALTFDDGPDRVVTGKLLTLLKKHRVKATFCVVGHRARDNPAIIRRMVREGHTLCNHSWQHLQNLGKLSDAKIRKDLKATNKWIRRAVPGVRIQYFRAPYGNFTPRLNRIARELGMTPLSWLVDDHSYLSPKYGKGKKMVAHMVKRVKTKTRKGSIILSHEMLKPWTVTAYRTLLPWLKKRYKLIALPLAKPAAPKPAPPPAPPSPPAAPPSPPAGPAVPADPSTASPTAGTSAPESTGSTPPAADGIEGGPAQPA